jgi:hypothetical protein
MNYYCNFRADGTPRPQIARRYQGWHCPNGVFELGNPGYYNFIGTTNPQRFHWEAWCDRCQRILAAWASLADQSFIPVGPYVRNNSRWVCTIATGKLTREGTHSLHEAIARTVGEDIVEDAIAKSTPNAQMLAAMGGIPPEEAAKRAELHAEAMEIAQLYEDTVLQRLGANQGDVFNFQEGNIAHQEDVCEERDAEIWAF